MKTLFRWFLRFVGGVLMLSLVLLAWFWKSDKPKEVLRQKYAPAPSAFVEVQGMEVHYRTEGNCQDDTPIVLLHGTGASLHTWDGWVASLAANHCVVRLDLPAYGLTGPHPKGDYSMASYVSFLNDFLDKQHIKQCVLGGNSLGGSIAWNYALQYPDRVVALILVDAGGYPASKTTKRESPVAFKLATMPVVKNLFRYVLPRSVIEKSIANVYGDPSLISDELINRYYELSLHPGNRQAFIDRMSSRSKPTDTLLIKRLQMPALVMWGDRDLLIPLECAYKFQRDLPNDTLVVFKDLGHVPMEENPLLTVEVVKQFLAKLSK